MNAPTRAPKNARPGITGSLRGQYCGVSGAIVMMGQLSSVKAGRRVASVVGPVASRSASAGTPFFPNKADTPAQPALRHALLRVQPLHQRSDTTAIDRLLGCSGSVGLGSWRLRRAGQREHGSGRTGTAGPNGEYAKPWGGGVPDGDGRRRDVEFRADVDDGFDSDPNVHHGFDSDPDVHQRGSRGGRSGRHARSGGSTGCRWHAGCESNASTDG